MAEADPMAALGEACAKAAAKYDKANINARTMLLTPAFWTDVNKAMRGEEISDTIEQVVMPSASIVRPGLVILQPNSAEIGGEDMQINAMGSWFTMESRIVFDGVELATHMLGPDRLTAFIQPSKVDDETTVDVFVRTGDHETPVQPFTFTRPEPQEEPQEEGTE